MIPQPATLIIEPTARKRSRGRQRQQVTLILYKNGRCLTFTGKADFQAYIASMKATRK